MTHRIFCDFDGTISYADVTDVLLEAFAEPGWREIEAQWQVGAIGSAECMARQVALMRCSRNALDNALNTIVIDPDFADFVTFCRLIGASLTVVSDGLLYVVEHVLARAGIFGLPIVANNLLFLNEGRHAMLSPHASPDCRTAAATCKCAVVGAPNSAGLKVLIGNGRSDFCAAGAVDVVLAKGELLSFCRARSIPHASFESFSEVPRLLITRMANPSGIASHAGGTSRSAEL